MTSTGVEKVAVEEIMNQDNYFLDCMLMTNLEMLVVVEEGVVAEAVMWFPLFPLNSDFCSKQLNEVENE